jgi:hypothetical protein
MKIGIRNYKTSNRSLLIEDDSQLDLMTIKKLHQKWRRNLLVNSFCQCLNPTVKRKSDKNTISSKV